MAASPNEAVAVAGAVVAAAAAVAAAAVVDAGMARYYAEEYGGVVRR